MLVLYVLFYLIALVLFAIETFGVSPKRLNLLALGLLFWTLPPLLQTLSRV